MRAVRELGYTPNLAASALAAAQNTRIALIYTNPSSAYLARVAHRRAARRGAHRHPTGHRHLGKLNAEATARRGARAGQERGRRDPAAAAVRIQGA